MIIKLSLQSKEYLRDLSRKVQYRFTDYHYAVYLGNYSKFAMA